VLGHSIDFSSASPTKFTEIAEEEAMMHDASLHPRLQSRESLVVELKPAQY
jgi:hypothetical protein